MREEEAELIIDQAQVAAQGHVPKRLTDEGVLVCSCGASGWTVDHVLTASLATVLHGD